MEYLDWTEDSRYSYDRGMDGGHTVIKEWLYSDESDPLFVRRIKEVTTLALWPRHGWLENTTRTEVIQKRASMV